jgi:hypothetical protein
MVLYASLYGSHEYPRLAAAARDYLAIPASAISLERLFDRGRDLLGVRRFIERKNNAACNVARYISIPAKLVAHEFYE